MRVNIWDADRGSVPANLALTNNFAATSAPTTAADTTLGYTVGSVWFDTVAKVSYSCVDATAGAAVWNLDGAPNLDPTEMGYLNGASPGAVVNSKSAIYSAAGLVARSSAAPAAAGTNQSTATAMTAELNAVTGADGAKGVALPVPVADIAIVVVNTDAAAALFVYPPTGAQINALGANAAMTIPGGQSRTFVGRSATLYYAAAVGPAQTAPTAKTVTAAITAAELLGGLITTTGVTAPSVHQLPTGTDIDAARPGLAVNSSFDFTLINTGTGASDDATITVNTGVTIVGNPTVGALTDATIISGSGTFRARKTATATYVVYRLS